MLTRTGLLLLSVSWRVLAGEPVPALPAAGWTPLPELRFVAADQAREVFVPMQGSPPAELATVEGRQVVRLPCRFAGTTIERASWDVQVRLDMTSSRGLAFLFYCPASAPIAHFSVYFQSGEGWYSAGFGAGRDGEWHAISIDRETAGIEGKPTGWGEIRAIRISGWRAKEQDTAFYVADLGLIGGDSPVVIVRGDSVAARNPNEAESVRRFAMSVTRSLDEVGIPFGFLADVDLTPERLAGRKLVILPHNPGMPDAVSEQLLGFLSRGGALISFYGLPDNLIAAAGMAPGPYVRPDVPGTFSSMRAVGDVLRGLRPETRQQSWNVRVMTPVAGRSRAAAIWHDAKGESTGQPAITVSENCVYMSHVLLDDDWPAKRRLMLAMVGKFLPQYWSQAATGAIERIGRFSGYPDFAAAQQGIRQLCGKDGRAHKELAAAVAGRDQAMSLATAGDFAGAMDMAENARGALIRAWCLAQTPQPGEHRAFWCHSAFGIEGQPWSQAIQALADNGFTAILPNMLWGGTAFYPSEVLPTHPDVARRGDQVALCLAACQSRGLECHVWKVNWNLGGASPKDFVGAMHEAGRTQVAVNGTEQESWLCPSHPENQELEIASMVEVARKYAVNGLHFDYIRYPDANHCFCAGCKSRFEGVLGKPVADWPAAVRRGGPLAKEWLQFRCDSITRVVAAVAEQARQVRPGIKLSAAVFRTYPTDRDNVGQDWKLWCEKGYLDFVCPMDYTDDNAQFQRYVEHQLPLAGTVPCYPGIGLSCWADPTDVIKLVEQIGVTRSLKTGGFTVFNYDPGAQTLLPLCGLGVTRR